MAETKKFVDLHGLDVFWDGAQKYIDARDEVVKSHADSLNTKMDTRVKALESINHEAYKAADATLKEELLGKIAENANADALLQTAVATNTSDIKSIQDELDSLSGGVGSIATQIDNAIAELDLPNTYEAKGEAAKAEAAAKAYADDLASNYDAAGAAASAEQNAKAYADGLASNYDAAGAAATALTEAKAYADGLAADYDAAGAAATALTEAKAYADGLNTIMDGRVDKLEAIDHEAIATQAAADAVAAVVANAPEDLNTLKEVADYIAADKTKASEIETAISNLGQEDSKIREEFATADTTVLASAKSYADGLATNYDAAGAAATAEQNAKDYADGLATNYDAAGAAAQALADAQTYVDGKVDGKFDTIGSAATAEQNAKAYADGKFQVAGNYEEAGAAAQALTDAQTYVDGKVDGKFDTIGSAATAEQNAKKYTDDTIAAFEFASDDDINALFA